MAVSPSQENSESTMLAARWKPERKTDRPSMRSKTQPSMERLVVPSKKSAAVRWMAQSPELLGRLTPG